MQVTIQAFFINKQFAFDLTEINCLIRAILTTDQGKIFAYGELAVGRAHVGRRFAGIDNHSKVFAFTMNNDWLFFSDTKHAIIQRHWRDLFSDKRQLRFLERNETDIETDRQHQGQNGADKYQIPTAKTFPSNNRIAINNRIIKGIDKGGQNLNHLIFCLLFGSAQWLQQ